MGDLITIKGIRVSQSGYAAAPKPIGCPGHDEGTDCEDDPSNPCKACFLYDDDAGESRYWWDEAPSGQRKTWTYSQNNYGTDVTHGLTFTGTDDEWAEHLDAKVHQGIEVYNAKENHDA